MRRGQGCGAGPMLTISIGADLKPLQRAFATFQAKQAPFASALALTDLAMGVKAEERAEMEETFDTPTPFTLNSMMVIPATKARQVAVVMPKDIAAAYLEPYVVGGPRSLGTKRGMLVPRGAGTNKYGNLTRGKLASLKAKPNVFVGAVTTKGGKTVNGVWQRQPARRTTKGFSPVGPLKLLIQFDDTTEAPKKLDFYGRAERYLKRNASAAFDRAMRKALGTAR